MMVTLTPLPSSAIAKVREGLKPREPRTIAEWAPEHIRITEGPLTGSAGTSVAWSPDTFPLQQGIIDAIDDKRWGKVCLMTAPQAFGKTVCAAIAVLLHALAHRMVSAIYVAANSDLANSQWITKIRPAMMAHPVLRALIPDNPDAGGNRLRRDFVGTKACIHTVGSESVGNLSAKTAPVVICDDVHAYGTLPKFGHPADYAATRTGAYPADQCSLVYIGTGGTVDCWLWKSLETSAFFCPFVPCPKCETYQLLEWPRLQFDAENPDSAIADTWMACAKPKCDHRIVFGELPAMLTRHLWVSMPPDAKWVTKPDPGGVVINPAKADVFPNTRRNTNVAGFWCNALYWPWGRSWGDHAAEWIGRQGNPDKVKDFTQNILVIPYEPPEEDSNALTVDDVAAHQIEGHRFGTVPAEADVVTVTADVHDRFLYYIVRAWRREDGTSWLVDAGTLGTHGGPRKGEHLSDAVHAARVGHAIRGALEDLWSMVQMGWATVNAEGKILRKLHASAVLVDGKYRPDAVGQECMQRNAGQRERIWHMIQGKASSRGAKGIWAKQAIHNKRGHIYREVNVDEAKHVLRELLGIPRDRPGAWHTYADKDLKTYHRHMASEEFVLRHPDKPEKVWRKRKGAGPNHWWDDEVYQVAAALAVGVRLIGIMDAQGPQVVVTDYFKNRRKR